MKDLCVVCGEPIPTYNGTNRDGRVRTCCQDHSKLLDKHHRNVEAARAEWKQIVCRSAIIDSFIYGRVHGSVDC